VGMKEVEARTVSLRRLGEDGQIVLPLEEAVERLLAEAVPPDLRA
jgi:threonyl-tRNA synthetase